MLTKEEAEAPSGDTRKKWGVPGEEGGTAARPCLNYLHPKGSGEGQVEGVMVMQEVGGPQCADGIAG